MSSQGRQLASCALPAAESVLARPEVWMYFSGDMQVYLDVPHSSNPKPSWYGESIGHYEGDTLVVDTIGFNDNTVTDIYRTPPSDKMHVVEC